MKYRDINNKLKERVDKFKVKIYEEMVQYYSDNMSRVLKEKSIFDENSFKKFEKDLRQKTIKSFEEKLEMNDIPIDLNTQAKLERNLKQFRERSRETFQENQQTIVENIKLQVEKAIEDYVRNINDFADSSPSAEAMERKHQNLCRLATTQLTKNYDISHETFFAPFKNELIDRINEIFQNLKRGQMQKQQEIQHNYDCEAKNIREFYIKV